MREKLIELLLNMPGYLLGAEGLADHLIANGVTIQKWIPASDPPKESGMYNVTVEKLYGITYSDVAYFDAMSKKWGTNTHHYSCDKVTHWMPLPEPPKEV
jgi:hypothetical protein